VQVVGRHTGVDDHHVKLESVDAVIGVYARIQLFGHRIEGRGEREVVTVEYDEVLSGSRFSLNSRGLAVALRCPSVSITLNSCAVVSTSIP